MTKNLDLNGLQSIADNYDLFYIDLWGVVHNGVNLHEKAIAVLNELLKKKKMLVLLTNAPRPNKTVQNFLEKMGMDKVLRDHVFTLIVVKLESCAQVQSQWFLKKWVEK